MALRCGIVGLPNVGKSMLFNALSNGEVPSENFPFCTIDPNIALVSVPDDRIDALASWVHAQKTIPTSIEFVDIAGLVQGAHEGEGLGNQFLGHIRQVDAIVHLVRCFHDERIIHVAGQIDPVFDKQVIDHELQCKDKETLTKKIAKLAKLVRSGGGKDQVQYDLAQRCLAHLESSRPIRLMSLTPDQAAMVASWELLTSKPVIYFANVAESDLSKGGNRYVDALKEVIQEEKASLIVGCASLEAQLQKLTEDEKVFFATEYDCHVSSLDQLIQVAYTMLDLITYFTAGPKEVRAWTIPKGTHAAQAAGIIHTDFERGFIKAEVIAFSDYQRFQSEAACRQAGKLQLEGKDYIVQDGDVILFRFNV